MVGILKMEHLWSLEHEYYVGFNPVQKLPAYEFLNKENKQCESITHKTHIHRDFPLDPKTGTTSLIFHYVPFNVTIHIYTCRSIQYHGPKSIMSNTMDRKPSCPIPWTENHCVQKSCVKIMHRTIGGSAQPNIGSKTKIFWGAAVDPIKWGYGCPSNPLLTMWKEYNTTQQSPTCCFLSTGGHRRA